MAVFHNLKNLPDSARGAVVAIGNFDGVHRGHQAVIATARKVAEDLKAPLAVLSFEPHPRLFFKPEQESFRLTPVVAKARALQKTGIDHVFLQAFTEEFAALSAEDFIQEVLVGQLGACHLVVGADFCFGKGRSGNVEVLEQSGKRLGFGVTGAGAVLDESGEVLSSSRVRQFLRDGKPREAAAILGRCWEIDGPVIRGFERGRTIGFPTANLSMSDYLTPALGVYAVRVAKAGLIEGTGLTYWYDAVANIGRRPTVKGEGINLEVFIFDFDEDLYGTDLRVQVVDFLRPEMKFDGLDELKAQIARDCEAARAELAKMK
ncbi:bifunctional riboflavin kinase/FAD synthetase [Kiloniella sp. b19]|uniref:bifunctional riboflavin kinase/FAD synthetase n=1 Tax=Kiloniella sp. GXU_MW_B19 TaxID=3141326 RepID=UPI0031E28618